MKTWIRIISEAFTAFLRDEGIVRASSLAFYTSLSLAPIVLLFVSITGMLGPEMREDMIRSVERSAGPQASEAISLVADGGEGAESGRSTPGGFLAISLAIVLFSSAGAFAAMQHGLNRIWNVKPAPGAGLKTFARKRLLSMGMVLALGFILLVSTVASTVIEMLLPAEGWPWRLLTAGLSLLSFTLLFAAIFRFLPDVRIAWRDVWFGSIVTAGLFMVGKAAISMYIARAGFDDSYGAAGALVAWLVFAYYSAIILYLGAELTQAHAREHGRRIAPDRHTVAVKQVLVDHTEHHDAAASSE